MSRLIAKVPANWEQPVLSVRGKRKLAEFSPYPYATAVAEWDAQNAAWTDGTHSDIVEENVDPSAMSFEEWHGERPVPADYAPWSAEEATWVQLWNDVGPGHPVTPPFATILELHEHLVTSGETYINDVGLGPGPSAPYQRHDAGFYVQQFEKSQAARNTNDHAFSSAGGLTAAKSKRLTPSKPGFWWVSFDDGEGVVDTALLDVQCYKDETTLQNGGHAYFLSDPPGEGRRHFTFHRPDQEIVQPGRTIATGSGLRFNPEDQWRITWIAVVKPPRTLPRKGDAIDPSGRPVRR